MYAAARYHDRFWGCHITRRWADHDLHRAAGSQPGRRVNGGAQNPAASNIKHFITERRLSCWAERPTCIRQEKIRPKRIYGDTGNYKKSISQDVFIMNPACAQLCVRPRIHQPFSLQPAERRPLIINPPPVYQNNNRCLGGRSGECV